MAQQTVSAAEDKETSLTERRMLLAETLEQQKRCEQLTQQEADLRGQLSLYSDKFEEFQKTLTKSNQVFGTFKKEMDKVTILISLPTPTIHFLKNSHVKAPDLSIFSSIQMSKTIGTLEKEMLMWKGRYEKCNKSLLDMAQEVWHYHGNSNKGRGFKWNCAAHTAHGDGTECTATQNQER